MSDRSSCVTLSLPILLMAVGACTPIRPEGGKSPLAHASMTPKTCVLDIFFVRFPFGEEEANGPLWDEIDEQHFPCDLRRKLAENGFRVGLVGGQMPAKLAQLMELENKPAPNGESGRINLADLETAPTVVHKHLQLPPGRRYPIVASNICDEMHVLTCGSEGLVGRTYPDAQAVFELRACPEPDGRIRLEIVPQLQYGQPQRRFVGSQGAFRLETGPSKEAFDELTIPATLNAADMVVMSSLPDRLGSLGHRFFTRECSGHREQKLLVIRLSQTQHDGLFSDGALASREP